VRSRKLASSDWLTRASRRSTEVKEKDEEEGMNNGKNECQVPSIQPACLCESGEERLSSQMSNSAEKKEKGEGEGEGGEEKNGENEERGDYVDRGYFSVEV